MSFAASRTKHAVATPTSSMLLTRRCELCADARDSARLRRDAPSQPQRSAHRRQDCRRRRGLGRRRGPRPLSGTTHRALTRHLAAIALAAGLRDLIAEVLPENTPMLQVFARSGLPMTTIDEHEVVQVSLEVGLSPAPPDRQLECLTAPRTSRCPCRRRCRAWRAPSWHCASPSRREASPARVHPTRRSGGRARSRRH